MKESYDQSTTSTGGEHPLADVIVTAGALAGPNSATRKHTVAWSDPVTGGVVSVVVSFDASEATETSTQQDEAIEQAKRLVGTFREKLDGPVTKLQRRT